MRRDHNPALVTTGANGTTELPTSDIAELGGADDLRLVARKGAEVTLGSVSTWSFGQPSGAWKAYIYTDRPVYRPGDVMHFRGVVRQIMGSVGYDIPASQSMAVQITDAEGKSIYTKHLTTNAAGILHDDFKLDRWAALGSYSIQIAPNESGMNGNFEVQEYKKPEYEVRVTPDKPRVLEGDSINAVIEGRYYFGEPVRGAHVQYSVYRSRYWYPLWADAQDEDNPADQPGADDQFAANEEVSKADGQLDEDGKLRISFRTEIPDRHYDLRYRVEARVTDAAGREISGAGWAVATYGSFLVSVEPQRYVYQPSTPGIFNVQTLDYDGRPVSTSVSVGLRRWKWPQNGLGETQVLPRPEQTVRGQ